LLFPAKAELNTRVIATLVNDEATWMDRPAIMHQAKREKLRIDQWQDCCL